MTPDKIEIIPAIDLIGGRTVRLSQGDYDKVAVYELSPTEVARRYVDAGLRRVHVVDLEGAKKSSPVNLDVLREMSSIPGIEIEWGGGIKSDESLRAVLDAGATYAIVGSVAAQRPALFEEWLELYGPGRIIFGADLLNGNIRVSGWLEDSDASLDSLLQRFIAKGLQRTICTDISKDGMLAGPSFELYSRLQNSYPEHNFTVSGGISSMADIERLESMGLKSVIVGKALYEGHISLGELAAFNDAKRIKD